MLVHQREEISSNPGFWFLVCKFWTPGDVLVLDHEPPSDQAVLGGFWRNSMGISTYKATKKRLIAMAWDG